MEAYLILAAIIYGYCMFAKPLSKTIITAPMIFIFSGVALHFLGYDAGEQGEHMLHLVAEIALAVLLFIDAAKIEPAILRQAGAWPIRMLLIGLPLVVVIGTLAGMIFFPHWPLMLVALAAAILAPTDAALGQPVVTNPDLPVRTKEALTIESGLNDGLALPLVLLFASLAGGMTAAPEGGWVYFGMTQILFGAVSGFVTGLVGGLIVLWANRKGFTEGVYEGVAALSLTFLCYSVAIALGGNGFIAAFVGGLGFGAVMKGRCTFVYEFTESEGNLLAWAAFFLLGLVLVPEAMAALDWRTFGLIMVSLFVVRPLAIWISLIGSDADPLTRIFFGWFGPRGLATALFALLILDQIAVEHAQNILHLAINAVWMSAILHGVSANIGAKYYAKHSPVKD